MASTYLSKTYGSAGNRKTMTFSFWIKRGNLSTTQYPMSIFDSGTGFQADMRFSTTDIFRMYSTDTSGTPALFLVTNRLFRDTSAWYHMVWEIDTTQATASDRVKLYVNGVQETSFSTETYPAQNTDLRWNGTSGSTGGVTQVGAINAGSNFDGSMAHFHFIDGTAYDADTFGETDATTGIWKPKTAPSVTYGTNGFFLKFENSGAFGTDSSGNANNFTVNGTMTQTIDTPSNVFATLNPLEYSSRNLTFSNGNLSQSSSTLSGDASTSSIGVSSGKWYYEVKIITSNSSAFIGLIRLGESSNQVVYMNRGGTLTRLTASGTAPSGFTNGDIIGVAVDMDNLRIQFYRNGSADGDYCTFTNDSGDYVQTYTGNDVHSFDFNFGNGYFGTTAVSSAENPDDGIGIFEYAVPTGYKALCTKSINAQEYS